MTTRATAPRRALALSLSLAALPAAAQVAPAPTPAPRSPWEQSREADEVSSAETVTSRVGRITFEVLCGLGGGAIALAAGVGIGCGVTRGRCEGDPLLYGGAIGAAFGVPAGVAITGHILHARGSFGWALLGEAATTVSGAFLAYALDNDLATGVIAVVAPVLGAVLGYELSSGFNTQRPRSPAAGSWAPALALTPGGASLGVGGAF